jgi:hypothetical protein
MFVEFVAHTHTHGAASEWVVVEFRHSLPQLKQQIFSSTDAHSTLLTPPPPPPPPPWFVSRDSGPEEVDVGGVELGKEEEED